MFSRTALHEAALADDLPAAQDAVASGAVVDSRDRLGFTPLHFAAQEYSASVAELLIQSGAEIDVENTYGNTPLYVAVFNSRGRPDLIKILLAQGADPLHMNRYGQTPAGLADMIANYDVGHLFRD